MLPRSPEGKIAWIVFWMLVCFASIFYVLARIPANRFDWLFD